MAHGRKLKDGVPIKSTSPIDPIEGFMPKKLTLNLTGNRGEGHRVDAAIYRASNLPKGHVDTIADMGLAEICIEGKTSQDPFHVTKDGLFGVKPGSDFAEIIGQICGYASDMMYQGRRTHCFFITVFAKKARLLHFSRSMVTITRVFSVVDEPDVLPCFFHIFNNADEATRGWDTSLTLCSIGECMQIIERIKTASEKPNADPALATFIQHFREPLHKFSVPNTSELSAPGQPPPDFIECIGPYNPLYRTDGVFGRGSEGRPVWIIISEGLGWLKRQWRINMKGIDKEGDTYSLLHKHSIPHVPTILGHGDIMPSSPHHTTKILFDALQEVQCDGEETAGASDLKWDKGGNLRGLRVHTHYQMLIKEVGRPLDKFKSPREATRALECALIGEDTLILFSLVAMSDCTGSASTDAYEICGVLHRDVSGSNIMIHGDGGLLCDWEFAKRVRSAPYDNGVLHMETRQNYLTVWSYARNFSDI
jgi:hypothetical protein